MCYPQCTSQCRGPPPSTCRNSSLHIRRLVASDQWQSPVLSFQISKIQRPSGLEEEPSGWGEPSSHMRLLYETISCRGGRIFFSRVNFVCWLLFCSAIQTVISVNVIITKHTATIPLIFVVNTLTKLMWLQVTGEETVFEQLVTQTICTQTRRPVLQRWKASISSVWSLYALRTTSSNDVTCISPEYHIY